jgi:hypothetical protein
MFKNLTINQKLVLKSITKGNNLKVIDNINKVIDNIKREINKIATPKNRLINKQTIFTITFKNNNIINIKGEKNVSHTTSYSKS